MKNDCDLLRKGTVETLEVGNDTRGELVRSFSFAQEIVDSRGHYAVVTLRNGAIHQPEIRTGSCVQRDSLMQTTPFARSILAKTS